MCACVQPHRYYHREGLWLSPTERATLGTLHLCYATALMRAWARTDTTTSTSASGGTATGSTEVLARGHSVEVEEAARTISVIHIPNYQDRLFLQC